MSLLYAVQNPRVSADFRAAALENATPEDALRAVQFCLSYKSRLELCEVLTPAICAGLVDRFLACVAVATPLTVGILLDRVPFVYPDTASWHAFLDTGQMHPETLRVLLAHRAYRGSRELPNIPLGNFPPGWGIPSRILIREDRKQAYRLVYEDERRRRVAQGWRCIFWSAVLFLRIRDFQCRYWAYGGRGYLTAKTNFERLAAAADATE